MNKVLLDSDVLLDLFFDRKPFSEDAARIISLCEERSIIGFVTPVICSNMYYLLLKTSTHERVIQRLTQLIGIVDVLEMNKSTIIEALHSDFRDFEDALQHFVAVQNQSIDIIITRNVKDYKKSSIPVLTPNNYIKLIQSQ